MAANLTTSVNSKTICDIVIPVHNAAHWVDWCVDAVIRHDSERVGRVLLVDDGSEPAQSELIRQIGLRSNKVSVIQTRGPDHGFAIACNCGAAESASPYLLFLNSDCLITDGCIESLLASFNQDSTIVLSCPVSNNSPALTYPMIPGHSYVDMNRLCREPVEGQVAWKYVLDACTVVGNCLMVRKDFFEMAGGFDPVWGQGYGEETDLHMKAFSKGLRGVVVISSYVYHFGSGTFRYEIDQEQLKKRNFALFMSKWGSEYRMLSRQCAKYPPMAQLRKKFRNIERNATPLQLDVLFYLPVLNQSTGGVHAVVSICNALVRAGVRACCAVVGDLRRSGLDAYQEPLFFEFLHFPTNQHFLTDKKVAPRLVISTIFSSVEVVSQYARVRMAKHMQFVQGYEAYFESGRRFDEFVDSLQLGDVVITTSSWLESMISRHLSPAATLVRLPLGINEYIFYPNDRKRQIGRDKHPIVGATLRSAPDKGQGMVMEVLDRMIIGGLWRVIIFRSASYTIPKRWPRDRFEVVELPADQISIAKHLRNIDVFLDASLHEGFGLMPLEALACGCRVVCSDSGGIRDFVKNGVNGFIIKEISDPDIYIEKIQTCLHLTAPKLDDTFLGRSAFNQYALKIFDYVRTVPLYDKTTWLKQMEKLQNIPLSSHVYAFLLQIYLLAEPQIPRRIRLGLKAIFGQSV